MINARFVYGFADEIEKHAESLRSLGFTDPVARKKFSKALRMMPKGGEEGRHSAIKETRKGFRYWSGQPGGSSAIAAAQKGLAESPL